jgi:hypothetical protein
MSGTSYDRYLIPGDLNYLAVAPLGRRKECPMFQRKARLIGLMLLVITLTITAVPASAQTWQGSKFYPWKDVLNKTVRGPDSVNWTGCHNGENPLSIYNNVPANKFSLTGVTSPDPFKAVQIMRLGGLNGFYTNNGNGTYTVGVCSTNLGNAWAVLLVY